MDYLILALVVVGINLLPAFAPPTWAVLVLYRVSSHLSPVPLVLVGALSATTGRYLLAVATGLLRNRLSPRILRNLDGAKELLTKKISNTVASILVFGLSPLPSAQLFEAAGLIKIKMAPLLSAFFIGRLVNYGIAVAGASTLKSMGVSDLIMEAVKSPWSIAFQLLMIYGIYLIATIDWNRFSKKKINPDN